MKRAILVREKICFLVRLLTNEHGLRVQQRGSRAYVTYAKSGRPDLVNIPYIADDASDEFLDAIEGFVDHEVAHILFSDYTQLARAKKLKVGRLHNAVEDAFIERMMAKKFTGSGLNLSNTGRYFLTSYTDKQLAAHPEKAVGLLLVPVIRAMSGQSVYKDYMEDKWHLISSVTDKFKEYAEATLPNITTTKEAVDAALKIRELIDGPEEEKPEPDTSGKKGAPTTPSGKYDFSDKPEDDDHEDDYGDTEPESEPEPEPEPESDTSESTEEESKATKAPASEEPSEPEAESDGEPEPESDGEPEAESGGEPEPEPEPSEPSEGGSEEEGDSDEFVIDDEEPEEASEPDEDYDPDTSAFDDVDHHEDGDGDGEEGEEGEGDGPGEEDSEILEGSDPSKPGPHSPGGGEVGEKAPSYEDIEAEMGDEFDEAISKLLSEDSARESRAADYLVYSRENDRIEPMVVGDCGYYDDTMLKAIQDEVDHMVGPLQKDLERAIAARSAATWSAGHRSGRLHSSSLARLTSFGDDRAFRRKHETTTKDVAVELLIDCSGSMNGSKIKTAAYAAYGLSCVLDRMGIAHEVLGFTTRGDMPEGERHEAKTLGRGYSRSEPLYIPIFKGFQDRLNTDVKKRFAALPSAYWLSENVDGESVQIAATRLLQRREKRKILIVLSDGQPCCPGDWAALQRHLSKTVKEVERKGVDVLGLGIMSDAPKHYYSKYTLLNNISDLPTTVIGEIKRLLMRS